MDRNTLKNEVLLNKVREQEEVISELRVDVHILLEQKKQLEETISELQLTLSAQDKDKTDATEQVKEDPSESSTRITD